MAKPELSVIIATRNRSVLLRRCLEALREQTEDPANFEVIVADDGSRDNTRETLEQLDAPFPLHALHLEHTGKPGAQNVAIDIARGATCLLLDDDVIPSSELVAEHLAAHNSGDAIVGIGRLTQQPPDGGGWYAREFASNWNRRFDDLEGQAPDWTACYGANVSAPRASLIEVGGVAVDLPTGNDIELGFRLQHSGCTPRYLPRAHAVHDDQKPDRRLLADSERQGGRYVMLAARHPAMSPRLLGWFGATSAREQILRRLLIALRIPVRPLAALGGLLPGDGRQQIWFQFVSRFAFWRSVRRSVSRECWVRMTHGVPVLMYHAFGDEDDRYVVSRRALARQMRLLALLRFRPIPFEQLATCIREHELPPARALAITIDDGYRDNLETANPIFARHGFPVTLYLVSQRIGGVNDWTPDGALGNRPLLSAEAIDTLLANGTSIGAHTRTHCSLPDVAKDEMTAEIAGSKNDLEGVAEQPIKTFAYPFGRSNDRVVATARAAGFVGACGVRPRLASLDEDPFLVPRIEVRGEDSMLRFAFKLFFGVE